MQKMINIMACNEIYNQIIPNCEDEKCTVATKSLCANIFWIKRKRVDTVLYSLFLIFN